MFDDNNQQMATDNNGTTQMQDQPYVSNDQPQYQAPQEDNSQPSYQAAQSDTHQNYSDSAMADHSMVANPVVGTTDDDLLAIKQDALNTLSPLVGQLDQSPEEKFRTTMMMIQASDDSNLIRSAYEAAQAIEDEKVRAQALLDVINEINYFTSHQA